jgi:uncharacterized membrane protein required for colicin V production
MYVDIALVVLALLALKRGYSNGFLATVLGVIGYIAGGVAGLYLSLQLVSHWSSFLNQVLAVIAAIFIGAQVGLVIFGKAAKFFHAQILWKPLKVIDSFAGMMLELARRVIFCYLVLSIMIWSPTSSLKTQINESQIYAQLDQHLPTVITDLKDRAKELLKIDPISQTKTKYVATELLNLRP